MSDFGNAQLLEAVTDILAMNGNVADLTLIVLENIRDELRTLNKRVDAGFADVDQRFERLTERVDHLTERVDHLTERVDHLTVRVDVGLTNVNGRVDRLTDRVDSGFAGVNDRLDNVIKISGTHHGELETRVRRIEDHLGL